MKYYFESKRDDISQDIKNRIDTALKKQGHLKDKNNPDLVIAIGGDGTFLNAVQIYQKLLETTHFVGINTGTLGFYCDFLAEEAELLIEYILNNQYTELQFHLIDIKVTKESGITNFIALNELRLENNITTQTLDILINDEYFETIRGNGICISTPSGSTAYNKSLNGAVVHPKTKAIQLVEIASISNKKHRTLGSPLILSEEHTVTLTSKDFTNILLGMDHLTKLCKNILQIDVKLSKRNVKIARYRNYPFLKRVKDSFID